jgi:hypothetical protein
MLRRIVVNDPSGNRTLAMKTGRTVERTHEGRRIILGPIRDPVRLIAGLQTGPD